MAISIEKEITEMNLDIDRVIRLFFSLKYNQLYRLGLDGIYAWICSYTLNLSQSVPQRYINKLPGSVVHNSCIKLMTTNKEAQMGIYLKEKG